MFGEFRQKPSVDCDYRVPAARQNRGYLQQFLLNLRDWNYCQSLWPSEKGPETASDVAETTHSKTGCQGTIFKWK